MSAAFEIIYYPEYSFEAAELETHEMLREIERSDERLTDALQGLSRVALLSSLQRLRRCSLCDKQPPNGPALVQKNAKTEEWLCIFCKECLLHRLPAVMESAEVHDRECEFYINGGERADVDSATDFWAGVRARLQVVRDAGMRCPGDDWK